MKESRSTEKWQNYGKDTVINIGKSLQDKRTNTLKSLKKLSSTPGEVEKPGSDLQWLRSQCTLKDILII